MSLVSRLRDTARAAHIGEVTPPPELFEQAADQIEWLEKKLVDAKTERDIWRERAMSK